MPSFSFCAITFPLKGAFSPKKSKKISRETGTKEISSKQARANKTQHTQERKKKPREQKALKRVQVKVRDRLRAFFPSLSFAFAVRQSARAQRFRESGHLFPFFSKDSEKKNTNKEFVLRISNSRKKRILFHRSPLVFCEREFARFLFSSREREVDARDLHPKRERKRQRVENKSLHRL